MNLKEHLWNVYAKSLHMCQWWALFGLEVWYSDVSGVDTALLSHNATLHEFILHHVTFLFWVWKSSTKCL